MPRRPVTREEMLEAIEYQEIEAQAALKDGAKTDARLCQIAADALRGLAEAETVLIDCPEETLPDCVELIVRPVIEVDCE